MKAVYNSWGKGKYDPRFNQDGENGPQVIPPAYGLEGIHSITSTGDGDDVSYWNRYVGITQMGGHGTFVDPRLGIDVTNGTDDRISAKLPALRAYQLSLLPPPPPPGSFDADAAARGQRVFAGAGKCISPPTPHPLQPRGEVHKPNRPEPPAEVCGNRCLARWNAYCCVMFLPARRKQCRACPAPAYRHISRGVKWFLGS